MKAGDTLSPDLLFFGAAVSWMGKRDNEQLSAIPVPQTEKEAVSAVCRIRTEALEEFRKNRNPDSPAAAVIRELADSGIADPAVIASLPKRQRNLYLRRYWYGVSAAALAAEYGCSENKIRRRLQAVGKKFPSASGECCFTALNEVPPDLQAESFLMHRRLSGKARRGFRIGGALLVLLAAVLLIPVLHRWSLGPFQYYFRDCKYNWEDAEIRTQQLYKSDTDKTLRTAEFSWLRRELTEAGAIPPLDRDEYQVFSAFGQYHPDGTPYRITLLWQHLSYRQLGYHQLELHVYPSPDGSLPKALVLPLDDEGQPLPEITTVTETDGVTVYAACTGRATPVPSAEREKSIRLLIFYKNGIWYELEGSLASAADMGDCFLFLMNRGIKVDAFPLKQ